MSLAITEKRPQRPGGCVGIFFQIFSKKKLFSKKLLPPVRTGKKAVKNFGTVDKMPMAKLLLIADENRGGFPKLDSEPDPDLSNRMQAPGLVARLMGLESMPVVHHEKPRKALDSKICYDKCSEHSRLDQGLCLDSGRNGKIELRPQKLQKTGGFLEPRPLEVFQKVVLSGSRKKQHLKLGSPVKSPRLLSRSNAARLVQVANKILEPGLQSRSRAKCAITYMGSLEAETEGAKEPLTDSLVGSCSSCRSFVEVSELRIGAKQGLATEYGSSALDFSNGSKESKKKSQVIPSVQMRDGSLAVQAKLNAESRARDLIERKQQLGSNQDQCKLRKDLTLNSALKKNNLRHNQLLPFRDRVVPGTKVCSRKQGGRDLNGAKDFVALNKNLNNCTRSRLPTNVSGSCRVEPERSGCKKNMCRKRRPINSSQIGNVGAINSNFAKERSVGSDMTGRKGTGIIRNQSLNRSCIKSELQKVDGDNFSGSKDNGIVSFTFNSPMRRDSRSLTHEEMVEKRRGHGELTRDAVHPGKLVSNAKIGNSSSERGTPLRGGELSNLLEEKIRELTSLDQEELAIGCALPGRSTASILEELISALTMGAPESQKIGDSCSDVSIQSDINISRYQMINIDEEFQEKSQPGIAAAYLASDSDQPSPISILEASFSNDSCSLRSLNGSSGGKPHIGLPEICNKKQLDPDTDLLDSATSLNISKSGDEKIHYSINKTSSICEVGVSETKVRDDTEAISDAELLFENISLYGSDETLESSLDSFLLNALETLMDAFCLNSKPAKEGNQLREFLFDCMMECLDSKYSHFCKSGFRTWLKLPLILNSERVMREVHAEIRGWKDLAEKVLDDLIEKDMSGLKLKWTECETEAFETGVEIQRDILQALIDEMVMDLC